MADQQSIIPAAEGQPEPLPTASIRAALARLALTCASTCDVRYYINGIFVEPRAEGGVYIAATDGHTLAAIIDPTGSCGRPVLLTPDRDTASRLPKIGSKGDADEARLELAEFRGRAALLLSDEHGLPRFAQVKDAWANEAGKFPDWRRVLPNFSRLQRGMRNTVNPRYVTRVLDAFKAAPCMTPLQECDDAVVVYQVEGHEYAVVLVMPMRDGGAHHRDAWATRWTRERASESKHRKAAVKTEVQPEAVEA